MAVNILSMAMSGGSSPVTLAGTLVNHNAEVLSGIVLSQLTRKGAKVIYGSSTTAMDLRLATASVGSPECAMISGAVARLAGTMRFQVLSRVVRLTVKFPISRQAMKKPLQPCYRRWQVPTSSTAWVWLSRV